MSTDQQQIAREAQGIIDAFDQLTAVERANAGTRFSLCVSVIRKLLAALAAEQPMVTTVEVLGHPGKPVSARCCIDGCRDLTTGRAAEAPAPTCATCRHRAVYGGEAECGHSSSPLFGKLVPLSEWGCTLHDPAPQAGEEPQ